MTQRKEVRSLNTELEWDHWKCCMDTVPLLARHCGYETLPSWAGLRSQAGLRQEFLGGKPGRISLLGGSMDSGWSHPLLDLNCGFHFITLGRLLNPSDSHAQSVNWGWLNLLYLVVVRD